MFGLIGYWALDQVMKWQDRFLMLPMNAMLVWLMQ